MLTVSTRTLNILAALVWYAGGVVLILKGGSLILEAYHLEPDGLWPWFGFFIGVFAGLLKAKFLFSKSCKKNLRRIASLKSPFAWQFYKPRFFVTLAFVSFLGARLSKASIGNFKLLIIVGALDLSIAVALLASSRVFWQEKAFARR